MSSSKMLYIAAASHQTALRRLAGEHPRRPGGSARTSRFDRRLLSAIAGAKAVRQSQVGTVIQRRFA